MAQKTDIRLRRSNTADAVPTHTNLSDGEMAMNTADGALYFKKSDNTIITAHDDTIMHIDSTNNAVDIAGALNITGDTVINSGGAGTFTFPTTGAGTRKIMMYPGGGNRLFWGNVTADEITFLDIALARIKGWVPGKNISTESLAAWSVGGPGNSNYLEFTTSTTADTGVVHKAVYVNAGETINVTLPISGNSNPGQTVNGLDVYAYQHHATAGNLPSGKTHVSDGATYPTVQEDDSSMLIKSNHQISSTTFTNAVGSATFDTAGWVSIAVQASSTFASTYSKVYIKDPLITVSGATRGDIVTMSYILN